MLARQFAVERHDGIAAIEAARQDWLQLYRERGRHRPFASPGFAIAALKSFHPDHRPQLWLVRSGDRAHAAFLTIRRPLKRLGLTISEAGFARNPHFILNDPLLGEGNDAEGAVRAFLEAWERQQSDLTLILDHLPRREADASMIARVAREMGFGSDPVVPSRELFTIECVGSHDDYLSTRSGDHRWQLKKIARKAAASKAVVEVVRTRDEISALLPVYFDIERRSWQGRDPASAITDRDREFAFRLLGELEKDEVGELFLLRVDGVPAAGLRMLGGGSVTCVHTMHFDQQFKAMSPGNLLIDVMIRQAFERGLAEIDLHGGSSFFGRWSTASRQTQSVRLYRPGVPGRLLRYVRSRLARTGGSTGTCPPDT